ncbi:MAG: phosphotransferase [Gammaproteobacteria bacterium]
MCALETSPIITESPWRDTALAVLDHYAVQADILERVPQGLVNLTLNVIERGGGRYVLQRLHSVFSDSVNANLAAVTAHLERAGLYTPLLVRTRTGALSVAQPDGLWRLLSFVEGRALDALESPQQAYAAGAQIGRFHTALGDFTEPLASDRPPVHDLARHLHHLGEVRRQYDSHPDRAAVDSLTHTLHEILPAVTTFCREPLRLVHGDPKISNLLFDASGSQAVCLIDLDTIAYMPLADELGDAFRSWCNPHAEDAGEACFDLDLFSAAARGYFDQARGFVTREEIEAIVPATLAIYLELAARFLADVLEDRYFAFDASRYASRSEHNLARARGQLKACASLLAQRARAEAVTHKLAARL